MAKDQNEVRQLLKDPNLEPTTKLIDDELGKDLGKIYQALTELITKNGWELNWRYYNDGKAWLGKVTDKKKTIFWLSAWTDCWKTSLFFSEKTKAGVSTLAIAPEIKKEFAKAPLTGKLIALILKIDQVEQLTDLETIAKYKQSAK